MKYANYIYNPKSIVNIGDYVQIFAIDYIYDKMGINKDDIIYFALEELPCKL